MRASVPSRSPKAASGADPSGLTPPTHRAWAEIDLGAVRDNVRALRAKLRAPARMMAVVKADAYGHGACEVARAAVEAGAASLGVATTEEGQELRHAGVRAPILLLGYTSPEDAETAVAHDLSVTVFQREMARALSAAASRTGRSASVHVKIDTGMGRIGVSPADAVALIRDISAYGGILVAGVCTHFATADEPDLAAARRQWEIFLSVLRDLEAQRLSCGTRHAANSAALLALPEAHLDLVRAGLAIYGIPPAKHLAGKVPLRPVMRLLARVGHVKRVAAGTPIGYGHTYRAPRETTIATIAVGYGDGYPRLAGGTGKVVLGGSRVGIAGRVSMDQCTVDAADLPVSVGDVAELWGETLPVTDVAEAAQTIPYEVLTGVSRRVPRVFVQDGRVVGVRTLLGDGP
jgi:alanine racemase